MRFRALLFFLLTVLIAAPARAHIGSPDVFYDGMVGPWPTHITIRMPGVVPGRAKIIAQVQSKEPLTVSFTPLSSKIAVKNAPPAEVAVPVQGETNLFEGDLWLMTIGAYSIDVKIGGPSGTNSVLIPVNSIATMQLPLPPWLGKILLGLGLVLCVGAVAIIASAAGESTLPPDSPTGKIQGRKYWTAACITTVVLGLALVGGWKWWNADEKDFRSRLREGGWPNMAAEVRTSGSQRILRLGLGQTSFDHTSKPHFSLAPDHGKLLHLFMVEQTTHRSFAHIHPVRKDGSTFEVALPPLPEGDYQLFCDLTLESGLSTTATNSVQVPAVPASADSGTANELKADVDDSWAADSAGAVAENPGSKTVARLPDGNQIIWKAHPPLRTKQDAGLQFEVLDKDGQPADLQPYMGMISHAAVLRADGRVFAHLHPSGNYSMAAQMFFDSKMQKESGVAGNYCGMPTGMDISKMNHSITGHAMRHSAADGGASSFSLPYEFPTPGNFRVWVQIKTGEEIMTAVFDTVVK